MAIIVESSTPDILLSRIRRAIDDETIVSWSYDGDGDLIPQDDALRGKGWLRPRVASRTRLLLTTVKPQETTMMLLTYGLFHSRFIHLLLVHFDAEFESVRATALPAFGDAV